MQFKDAAYEILKEAREPLHYTEITRRALERGILDTTGQTPHATMGALLYTDTLKPNSRFKRGDKKGTFALRVFPAVGIQQQIEAIDRRVRQTLRRRLKQMDPRKFESLITLLLSEMGLEDTAITTYGGDGGIDVRGVLNAENLSRINVAVQAKRWKGNVGPKVVRELRGSLKVHEHGIVITPSDFTKAATEEADEPGKTHISLINGDRLVDLLIEHQVGVVKEEYVVPVLDEEYWSEILGDDFSEPESQPPEKLSKKGRAQKVEFPLLIRAQYKGNVYDAELLDLEGRVRYAGKVYSTPSGAAKAVAVGWKAVNGWDFWRYQNPETGKWERIGRLKATEGWIEGQRDDERHSSAANIDFRLKFRENKMNELENQFHHAMIGVADFANRHRFGYRFRQMIEQHGALEAAKRLLAQREVQTGLMKLWELKALDHSMEAQVIQKRFRPLFSEIEIAEAKQRLQDLGYFG